MKLRRRSQARLPVLPATSAPKQTATAGVEFGWRVHDAIQGWTATVDVKASIVVAVETAVTGAAARELITSHGELHHAIGLHLACAIVALSVLASATGCGLWVVFPRLERPKTAQMGSDGLIYFGHLRARSSADIECALGALTPGEEQHQLADQLNVTAHVAWRKHAWLQRSLALFALGAGLLVLSFTAF